MKIVIAKENKKNTEINIYEIDKRVNKIYSKFRAHSSNFLTEEEKVQYKSDIELLIDNNKELGYIVKAWIYYLGDEIFAQNWKESEKYLLLLLEKFNNPYAACALGYIYYYGRVNNGEAEYDKALKFFSLSAAEGVIESQYKLTDLMMSGNGFGVKTLEIAYNVLLRLYREVLLYKFTNGDYNCEFADVAIRIGHYYSLKAREDGEEDALYTQAYRFYLIGKYALGLRMETCNNFGDKSVLNRLIPKLEEARQNYFSRVTLDENLPPLDLAIAQHFIYGSDNTIKVKKKNGKYVVKIASKMFKACNKKSLVVIPEYDFCKLIGEIVLECDNKPKIFIPKRNKYQVCNAEADDDGIEIYEFGKAVYNIVMKLPAKGTRIVKIK